MYWIKLFWLSLVVVTIKGVICKLTTSIYNNNNNVNWKSSVCDYKLKYK